MSDRETVRKALEQLKRSLDFIGDAWDIPAMQKVCDDARALLTTPAEPVAWDDEDLLPFPEYGAVTLCMSEDGDVLIYRCDRIPTKAKLLARGESVEDAWGRMLAPTGDEKP